MVVLPDRDTFNADITLLQKKLSFSPHWNLGELKERVVKVLNGRKYGCRLTTDSCRLWKLDSSAKWEEQWATLKMQTEQIRTAAATAQEKNWLSVGIEMAGCCLDWLELDTPLTTLLLETDTLVLELANAKNEFIFRHPPSTKVGKCDFCGHRLPLPVACSCKEASYCSRECRDADKDFHNDDCPAVYHGEDLSEFSQKSNSSMGLTGLQNVGNSCFISSAIQCLSHTWTLTRYFLEDRYGWDINKRNKNGSKGDLANAYARLLKNLWYEDYQFLSHWQFFRDAVGKRHPVFLNRAQHDSQEFISALIDGLHEDLNRVHKNPAMAAPQGSSPDGLDHWHSHLSQNQSIIVDLMHGQFKSTLTCPTCHREAASFTAFSAISLPVPQEKYTLVTFYYVPYDVSRPHLMCTVMAETEETMKSFRERVGKLLNVNSDLLILGMFTGYSLSRLLCRERKVKVVSKLQTSRQADFCVLEINPGLIAGTDFLTIDNQEAILNYSKEESKKPAEDVSTGHSQKEEKKGGKTAGKEGSAKKRVKASVPDHDDYNNGLTEDWLKIFLTINQQAQDPKAESTKTPVTFTRIIYIKRSCTLQQLHYEVFAYLRPLFELQFYGARAGSDVTTEDIFGNAFDGLTEANWESSLKLPSTHPYVLRFVNNIDKPRVNIDKCIFCDHVGCTNCTVPFTKTQSLKDIFGRITPNEAFRNDYYYHKNQIGAERRRLLELEVLFNANKADCKMDLTALERQEEHGSVKASAGQNTGETIYKCLNMFQEVETLDESNTWLCESCQQKVRALSKMQIIRCPPILILHLKRFKTLDAGAKFGGKKLTTMVEFPLSNLDLRQYVEVHDVPPIYDLYAVCNHSGVIGYGHYVSHVWNPHDRAWFKFDDSNVTPVPEEEICTPNAYVLFYKRRDLEDGVDYEKIRQRLPPTSPFSPAAARAPPQPSSKSEEKKEEKAKGKGKEKEKEKEKPTNHLDEVD